MSQQPTRASFLFLLLVLGTTAACGASAPGGVHPDYPARVPRRSSAAECDALLSNATDLAPSYCCLDASTGRLHTFFRAEFGWEFVVALPVAYAAFQRGQLGRTWGCGDVAPLYFFSPQHTDVPGCARGWSPGWAEACGQSEHDPATPPETVWRPPPLRAHFRDAPAPVGLRAAGGALVVVSNKFAMEWVVPGEEGRPLNFFSVPLLLEIFALLHGHGLRVAYSRPAAFLERGGKDAPRELGEHDAISRHAPYVHTLRSLSAANPGLGLNELQLRVLARARHVVTVQGGPAWLAAPFAQGGDLVVLHRAGKERDGPGGEYQAKMPRLGGATVWVARSDAELLALVRERAPLWAATR